SPGDIVGVLWDFRLYQYDIEGWQNDRLLCVVWKETPSGMNETHKKGEEYEYDFYHKNFTADWEVPLYDEKHNECCKRCRPGNAGRRCRDDGRQPGDEDRQKTNEEECRQGHQGHGRRH